MVDTSQQNSALIRNPEKPCKCCAKSIPQAAVFCTHCENHQGWFRRNINLGETTLALLVAFVAILAASVPPVVAFFSTPDSDLHHISAVFTEGGLKVVMVNEGDRGGVFQLARVRFRHGENDPAALVNFEVPGLSLLAPGEARAFSLKPGPAISRDGIPRDIVLALQEADFAIGEQAERDGVPPKYLQCDVVFETISFSGIETTEVVQNRCVTAWLSLFPGERPLFQDAQKKLEAQATLPAS